MPSLETTPTKWRTNGGGFAAIRRSVLFACGAAAMGLALSGCRSAQQIREPAYARLQADVGQAASDVPAAAAVAVDPVVESMAGPHPVDQYIGYALAQNPVIQSARMQVESLAQRVPQRGSLPDPMMGLNLYPSPVQTAAGQQEVSLSVSQKVPWFGKLATAAEMAEQDVDVARAQLAAAERDVIEDVKRSYYQLYFVQKALQITEEDKQQLTAISAIVDRRYRVERKVTQQDVLNVNVAVLQVEAELVKFRQQLASAQARLARHLHVSPDTALAAVDTLPAEQLPQDVTRLYELAIRARPDLHAQLAAVRRDRVAVDLARLNYFPDLNLGVTWIDTSSAGVVPRASGRDAVMIGISGNLPIYRKRLEAGVHEVEAKAVAEARKYDALKDQTLDEVKDLFAQVQSRQELVDLFHGDIIPKSKLALDVSVRAYQVGEVDFLQMLGNWRDLLRFEITEQRLESELRQSLASLERVVGALSLAESTPLPVPAR